MAPNIKVSGRTTVSQAREDSFTSTEMCNRVNGKMVKLMEEVYTYITTELTTKENGQTTDSMGTAQKPGQMEFNSMDST